MQSCLFYADRKDFDQTALRGCAGGPKSFQVSLLRFLTLGSFACFIFLRLGRPYLAVISVVNISLDLQELVLHPG